MLICREFRKGKPISELFQRLDQSDAINRRVADFDGQWDSLDEATSSEIRPTPKLNSACRYCPISNPILSARASSIPYFPCRAFTPPDSWNWRMPKSSI
jgi:hypothetical protein